MTTEQIIHHAERINSRIEAQIATAEDYLCAVGTVIAFIALLAIVGLILLVCW